jgi:hypothetical protein
VSFLIKIFLALYGKHVTPFSADREVCVLLKCVLTAVPEVIMPVIVCREISAKSTSA